MKEIFLKVVGFLRSLSLSSATHKIVQDLNLSYVIPSFSLGLGVIFGFHIQENLFILPMFFGILLFVCILFFVKQGKLPFPLFLVFMFSFGSVLTFEPKNEDLNKTIHYCKNASIEGIVYSKKHFRGISVFSFQDAKIDGKKVGRLNVYTKHEIPSIGTFVRFTGNVRPTEYNSKFKKMPIRAFFKLNAPLQTFANKDMEIIKPPSKFSIVAAVDRYRESVRMRIVNSNGKSNAKGITAAITIGDSSIIDKEVMQNIQLSGLSHLLAISGLHITIIAGGMFLLSRRILIRLTKLQEKLNIKKISAIIALLFGFVYILLSNAPISAVRSLLFFGMLTAATLTERESSTLRTWATTFCTMLAISPAVIFSPSFQLSFAATFGLLAFFSKNKKIKFLENGNAFFKKSIIGRRVLLIIFGAGGLFVASAVATIATLFFCIYHFGYFSLGGIFANMTSIPILETLSLPFAFSGMILTPLGLDKAFFYISNHTNEIIVATANFFAKFEQLVFYFPNFTGMQLLISSGIISTFLLSRNIKFLVLSLIVFLPWVGFHSFGTKSPSFLLDTRHRIFIFNIDGKYHQVAPNSRGSTFLHQKILGQKISQGFRIMNGGDSWIECSESFTMQFNSKTSSKPRKRPMFLCKYIVGERYVSFIAENMSKKTSNPTFVERRHIENDANARHVASFSLATRVAAEQIKIPPEYINHPIAQTEINKCRQCLIQGFFENGRTRIVMDEYQTAKNKLVPKRTRVLDIEDDKGKDQKVVFSKISY